jgi:hypothetical protein
VPENPTTQPPKGKVFTQSSTVATKDDPVFLAKLTDVDFGAFGDTEIKPEDLKTPRIVVLNGQSQAVADGLAKPGEFFNIGTGRSLGTYMNFIPLGYFSGRLFFVDRELACRSIDRTTGDPGGKDAFGRPTTSCLACVYSKWNYKTPPECDVVYNYPVLVMTRDNEQPQVAFLSFRGTANDAARQLNGDHIADGKPWYFHVYEAAPQQRHNEKGIWWVTKIRRIRETTPEERDAALQAATGLAAQRITLEQVAADEDSTREVPM